MKSAGFVGLYLLFGLLAGFVCSGASSVRITLIADGCITLAGLLYYSRFVYAHDKETREAAGVSGAFRVGRVFWTFLETLAICMLLQLTAAMILARFPDASLTAYSNTLIQSNIFEALFLTLIAAPVSEEILMRGVVMSCLRQRFGVVPGIIISGMIFAILHGTLTHLYIGFVLGVVFGIIYAKTGSLLLCIFSHVGCNLLTLFLYGVSFSDGFVYQLICVGLNLWLCLILIYRLRGLRFDEKDRVFMSHNDFAESCCNFCDSGDLKHGS